MKSHKRLTPQGGRDSVSTARFAADVTSATADDVSSVESPLNGMPNQQEENTGRYSSDLRSRTRSSEGESVLLATLRHAALRCRIKENVRVVRWVLSLNESIELRVLWSLLAEDGVPVDVRLDREILQKRVNVKLATSTIVFEQRTGGVFFSA